MRIFFHIYAVISNFSHFANFSGVTVFEENHSYLLISELINYTNCFKCYLNCNLRLKLHYILKGILFIKWQVAWFNLIFPGTQRLVAQHVTDPLEGNIILVYNSFGVSQNQVVTTVYNKGLDPHLGIQRWYYKGIFRPQSNIWDGAFSKGR